MKERSFFAIAYTPVNGHVRKNVGAFLRYIQHRRKEVEREPAVDRLLKYVAHRDQSLEKGLLFGPDGPATTGDRKQLLTFVQRSTEHWKPQPYRDRQGREKDRRRAVHRMVLSPEHAQGLDLQQVTRAMMKQLEQDAGGIGPWIAAEHRNTKHPHVHIVLAGRREVAPGRYRTVQVTRPRLARMKVAMLAEIERQRGREFSIAELERDVQRQQAKRRGLPRERSRTESAPTVSAASLLLHRLAERYRREAEREAERRLREREREEEWSR